ncbi:MAG: serine/threonine-protein kinase [Planctomycetota bacterium]
MDAKRMRDGVDEGAASRDAKLIAAAREQVADRGQTLASWGDSGPWPGGPPTGSFTGYSIIRELHRGGQGVVYQALQESTQRKVAIKVMREGPFAGAADRARFDREVHILGQLNHPHIVAIHDTGSAAGHLYFVMDYIPGHPLDIHMAGAKHTLDETLRLFGKICDAVNAAHLRGVIHRDLKPSNIRIDPEGEPHILDFGLAKVAAGAADSSGMTLTGQFVGSLPWASPEQAEGAPAKIDVRTDVYALGVILYQMLTGRFPYEVIGPMRDVLNNILTAEPVRPSALGWQGVPGGRGGRLAGRINDEIDTIALKCLHKERERRYQTAGELARDVGHYLNGEPIEAKRDSAGYVLRKHLIRYKLPVAVAAGFLVVITVGLLTSLVLWQQASMERDRTAEALKLAERHQQETQQVADFQSTMLADTDVEGMGVALVDEFERRIRETLSKQVVDPGELDRIMHDWRQQTLKAGPTNVALGVLDEYVLAKAAKSIEKDFANQPLVRAALQQTVADTYRKIGLYEPAMALQQAALQTRREELGDDHLETLSSMHDMGALLHAMGKSDEAEPYFRRALEGNRRVLGGDHPVTLETIGDMGSLLEAMGKYEEAMLYCREALEGKRRILGDDHPETLLSINAMSILLRGVGELAEAESHLREALERHRRVLGNDHPTTLTLVNNMGGLLQARGQYAEALPYFREALEGSRRVLGDDHPSTLAHTLNMGQVLYFMGRLADAEPYCRQALEGLRRVLGNDHPHTLVSINQMGVLLHSMGKLGEAEPYFREVMEGCRRVLGNDHRNTLISINSMACELKSQGRFAEAEPYAREALERGRCLLGSEHPDTLTWVNNMGSLLSSMGRLAEAEPYWREALEGHRRVLGDDHPNTLCSIGGMADVLRATGRLAEAEPYCREALEKHRRVLGDEHQSTLLSISNMAVLLQAMGKRSEAEVYSREALERRRRVLGDDHRDTLGSINNLGDLLREMGRLEEAEALGAEAVRGARRSLPEGHPHTGGFLTNYGKTLAALARYAEAESTLLEAHGLLAAAFGPQHALTMKAVSGLADLYAAWHAAEPRQGHDAQAAEWRARLEAWRTSTQPASTQPISTQPTANHSAAGSTNSATSSAASHRPAPAGAADPADSNRTP